MKDDFNKVADIHGYHAHIYFTPGTASEKDARFIAAEIAARFRDKIEDVKLRKKAGGPHMSPNVAVHIKKEGFADIVAWLQVNNRDLSIAIHPETGNALTDHRDHTLWLGKQGGYNPRFFAMLKTFQKFGIGRGPQ